MKGGNGLERPQGVLIHSRFNEAALHEGRKFAFRPRYGSASLASMRPPFMKGGNPKRKCKKNQKKCKASMRPPFMKGGNMRDSAPKLTPESVLQ